jgi:enoyl-CoA hydratase/carnithine racemase
VIRVEHSGPRLDVILADPDRLNAMSASTWRTLAQIASAPPEGTRVIVIRAEGTSFSAGLDRRVLSGELPPNLAEMATMSDSDLDALIAEFQQGFTMWRQSDAITIAAVQGYAIGAGFQLALATDLRIAADDAHFAMRETSLGLVPDLAGTEPLLDLVGYSRALEICVSGRMVPAAEALDMGLINAIAPADELGAYVDRYVDSVLSAPESSVRATKRLLAARANEVREDQRRRERSEQRTLLRAMVEGR